jgi:hypothetical protein
MTTQTQQIRRRTNGTIDIDHYRNHALMLRREAMTNMARGVDFSVLRLIAVATLIVALIAMTSHGPAPRGTAANAAPAAITVALETC